MKRVVVCLFLVAIFARINSSTIRACSYFPKADYTFSGFAPEAQRILAGGATTGNAIIFENAFRQERKTTDLLLPPNSSRTPSGVRHLAAAFPVVAPPANIPSPFRAKTDTQQDAPPPPPSKLPLTQLQRNFKSLPFNPGEKLTYELKYTRFPLNVKVGEITFEFAGEANHENWKTDFADLNVPFVPQPTDQYFRLRANAISKGILTAIIGYDVNNQYATLVNREDFSARLHHREIKEGKKHQRHSALFEQDLVNYSYNDLTKPDAPAKNKTLVRQPAMLDLLSAFFFVRLQKLKEGEMVRYPVSDNGFNYMFDIVVGKKEQLKTDCGKIKTIRIEPKLFGKDQLFGREGTMTMWLTDNKQHVPVKMIAKTGGNTISARLMNFKTNCQISEPEQEELR